MNVIAFDLGGSGGKVFCGTLTADKIVLRELHRFEHGAVSIGKNLFWDVLRIYSELQKGIKAGIEYTGDDIACLGIDSFCNDFCLLDSRGSLITQMHSYRDERTVRLEDRIYSIMSKQELYARNGNQCAPFNTLMQLSSMILEGQEGLFKGNHLLFLPDLLIYFLSGFEGCEYTLASVSQMFRSGDRVWDDTVLARFGIPKDLFVPVVEPGTINCRTNGAANAALSTKGFEIANVCEHDTASAFLASVSDRPHMIISCGTWAIAGTESPSPVINETGFKYNIANEGSLPGHHRILKNTMGTWLLQEIRADMSKKGAQVSFAEMEAQALLSEPFRYLIDVDDPSFFLPGNMPERIRRYCADRYGSAPETTGALVRCVYESLALKYRFCMEKLIETCKSSFECVNIIGGGSKSPLMCSFTANACALPVLAGPDEATAYGNIIAQLIAKGAIGSVEEGRALVRNSCKITGYNPSDTVLWDEKYKEFITRFNL